MRRRRSPVVRPWDPGLQNERTALAWIRTSLAALGVALVLARTTATEHAILSITLAVTSVLVAGWAVRRAGQRYSKSARSLAQQQALPDGGLPAILTALSALIGVAGLAYIMSH